MADRCSSASSRKAKLPYVDANRIHVYGVSLGGDVTMHLLARTKVRSAILGAGAPIRFLGVKASPTAPREDRFRDMTVDEARATANIEKVTTPILILVGTADSLLPINRLLHDRMEKAGKSVRMESYENGYHDFVMGPQGQDRPGLEGGERLMDITLQALESALRFTKRPWLPDQPRAQRSWRVIMTLR